MEKTAEIGCPKCRYHDLYRMKRIGILQIALFPLFGYFPWECGKCRKTSILKGRNLESREPVAQKAQ
jgi:predicted nucleic-acid-binding Zn-ribbon protein